MTEQPTAASGTTTPADIIGQIAPAAIRSTLVPGAAIATSYHDTHDWMTWEVTRFEDAGGDTYNFACESPESLSALCTVQLDREYRVAVHRATLTNTSKGRTRPMNEASALCLQLEGVTRPAVFSCSGAASNAGWPHAREYPPDAFRTRWMAPLPPRAVRFESGAAAGHQMVSSTKDLPIFMVHPEYEVGGPGLYIGIEWSTRWKACISFGTDRTGLRIVIGPAINQMVLDPGESVDLPAVHIGFFEGPVSTGSNTCRRYINDRVAPPYMGRPMLPPVVYSLWGLSSEHYKQDDLIKQVDVAAALGVEMFLCDVSWYVGGDWGGVGNWEVDLERFPEGLEPVAEYVRSQGMGMGLYFEALVHDDTKLLREHPEFFFHAESISGRNHMLNFARPDACDYFTDLISRYVELLDLRFIRADFGGYPIPPEGALTWNMFDPDDKVQFAYVAGKFRVWETLLQRHPKLMWEVNAGGGNCLDLGSMRRHHCAWGSDAMDIHACRMMQLGVASFIPGNFMGTAIICGDDGPQGGDAGLPDIAFLSRMAGSFYLCGHIDTWSHEERLRARRWIDVYKRIRHLLVKDFYRLVPQPQSPGEWDAAQFCDGDGKGIVFAFRYGGRAAKQQLLLQGVDADKNYQFRDESNGEEFVMSGEELRNDGVRIDLGPNSAKLYSYAAPYETLAPPALER